MGLTLLTGTPFIRPPRIRSMCLAAGGDVNERDTSGWTPLMRAALECRAKIVKLLLDRGADRKLSGKKGQATSFMDSGQTALTAASGCFIARRRAALAPERGMPTGYIDYELAAPALMVHDLIARGADVNAADADGRTPLMMAAMQGWSGVVRELLAAHAAVNVQDHEGRLAVDYVDPSNGDIVALLKNHGSGLSSGRSGRTVCDAERALDKLGYDTPIIDASSLGCDQCVAAQQQFPHFVPIDFARVQSERDPALRCDVSGKIESVGLGLSQRLIVAWQYFAGDRNNAVTVMVIKEISKGLFSDQKLGVRSMDSSCCLR